MHTLLKECKGCDTLQTLYDKIECTILYLSKNKNNSLKYNVDVYFDQTLFNDLVRYKRVIGARLYNCDYPSCKIKNADIIAYATKLAFRGPQCSICEDCFPELENPASSTTSSTTTTTP